MLLCCSHDLSVCFELNRCRLNGKGCYLLADVGGVSIEDDFYLKPSLRERVEWREREEAISV